MTTPRPDRKRKGSPEWIRLGELLADRRAGLSPDYEGHGGRAAFARDRDVNLKLIQDIELNARENITPRTLRDVIAPAYQVTYESVRRALEGGGSLEAAPRQEPGEAAFEWTPADAGFISPEEQAEMMPAAMTIMTAIVHAEDAGHDRASVNGNDLFPRDSQFALAWDVARQQQPWQRAIWAVAKGILQWEKDAAARRAGRQGSAGA